MTNRYASLGIDTASRRFEIGRGGAPSAFERRMRALEDAAENALGLAPELVHLAAEIAALEPGLGAEDRFALIVLILVSMIALEAGSTCFPVAGESAREPMAEMLRALCADSAEAIAVRIEKLLHDRGASTVIGYGENDFKPLIFIPPHIFHHRVLHAERAAAARLAAMLKLGAIAGAPEIEAALSESGGTALGPEQRAAAARCARSGLAIISGGPGTGKTTLIAAIVRMLVRLGVAPEAIALAAPTGKAAYRMGESVRAAMGDASAPATLHRLLGYSPESGRFRHHRNNPLAAKAAIIDEASMLDLALMRRLVDALAPDARLVLIGDAEQLPSVAAGAVFRDLAGVEGGERSPLARACVRLTRNYRTDRSDAGATAIHRVAAEINRGGDPMPLVTRRAGTADMQFSGAEFLGIAPNDLDAFLDRWYEARVRAASETIELLGREYAEDDGRFGEEDCARIRRGFAHINDSRILCVTRVFATGADAINRRIHELAAREAHRAGHGRPEFFPGEPIVALRNDYARGLFNGDHGIVLRVKRGERQASPLAVFVRGDNFAAFPPGEMDGAIELSYAATVHKAQGSEFGSIALVLPNREIPLLTREIVYTAISRGRRSAAIIGDESILRFAIGRKTARFSTLRARI
ncbi:MAG: exodeoxyribonuclease V subunit alpha [Candidatus Binataceae bacterium]